MAKVKEGACSDLSEKADRQMFVHFKGEVYTRKFPRLKKESWTPRIVHGA